MRISRTSTVQVGGSQCDRLVAMAKAGSAEALRALWAENKRWVAAVIITHKPAKADLDDLLQEVAATLCQKIGDVDDAAAFRGWLRIVAVNVARLAGRKQELRDRHTANHARAQIDPAEYTRDAAGAQILPGQISEEAQRVINTARGLPTEYSEPLLLRAVQGLSYRTIGEILGMPETTVETRIARARRMLREALEKQQAGVPSGARFK